MNLVQFLFEEYNQNSLALITKQSGGDVLYILYDIVTLQQTQLPQTSPYLPTKAPQLNLNNVFAAFVSVAEPVDEISGTCNNALMVVRSVANPTYKGAGTLLYKIVSSLTKRPIISDRFSSTSDKAKKVWDRFDKEPGANKQQLDSFIKNNDNNQQFVDVQGSKIVPRTEPKTQTTKDDCVLPNQGDIGSLGHPDSFQFNFDVSSFVQNHTNVKPVLEKLGIKESDFFTQLQTVSNNVFNAGYYS